MISRDIEYNQELFNFLKKRNEKGDKKKWIENRIQLNPSQRISICTECNEFRKITRQCKICFCLMDVKTKMKNKFCPKGKW